VAVNADISIVMKWLFLILVVLIHPGTALANVPACQKHYEVIENPKFSNKDLDLDQNLLEDIAQAEAKISDYSQNFKNHKQIPQYDSELLSLVNRLQASRRLRLEGKRNLRFEQARLKSRKRLAPSAELNIEIERIEKQISEHQMIADLIGNSLVPLRQWLGYAAINHSSSQLSKKHNIVLVLRSLHPASAGQLMHKGFGKGLAYKFHSADEGILAGMVPQNQKLSKKGKIFSEEQLKRLQDEVDLAIHKKEVISIPYRIGSMIAVERNGKVVLVDSHLEPVSYKEAVRVLAIPIAGDHPMPLVSDIDPFAFGFQHGEDQTVRNTMKYGLVTEREKELIKEFNRSLSNLIGKKESKNRFMPHGAENRNPTANGVNGYPLWAYLPDGTQKFIEEGPPTSPNQNLIQFLKETSERGFKIDVNPLWKLELDKSVAH
jgi:hypothetical protein